MTKPFEVYRVERKGGKHKGFRYGSYQSKGVNGGTVHTLKAAKERRAAILHAWEDAEVTIYRGIVSWEEVQ